MAGFTSGGIKLQSSVASGMVNLLKDPAVAAAAPALAAGPTVAAVVAAIAFIAELIEWLSQDDSIERALAELGEAIEYLDFLLRELEARLVELTLDQAREANATRLRALRDYLDGVKFTQTEVATFDPARDNPLAIAERAGLDADKFLWNNFDSWRWIDVVIRPVRDENGEVMFDERTGEIREAPALLDQFKNMPTLPVYIFAVLTWLAARELAVKQTGADGRTFDAERVRRHIEALSIRPVFDKNRPEETHADGSIKWTSQPATVVENIVAQIRTLAHGTSRYPENRMCYWRLEVQNWMTGEHTDAGYYEQLMENDRVLCTIDTLLPPPMVELEWEDAAGAAALGELRRTLEHVALSGTIRKPFVGRFPEGQAAFASFYAMNAPGQLLWFDHIWMSDEPGIGPARGPRSVDVGWNRFKFVLTAGEKSLYAVEQDGTLLWYQYEGAFTGTGALTGPTVLGEGWQQYASIAGGGGGVIYALEPNGTLWWYKHGGFETGGGLNTWQGRTQVATGWNKYKSIFSTGKGILYGIRPDGVLEWNKHKGFADGSASWEATMEVGQGWQDFTNVFGVRDGVIYAKRANAPLQWYRHESWETGTRHKFATIGGNNVQLTVDPVAVWEGPVQVGDDASRYVMMFGALHTPVAGGGVR